VLRAARDLEHRLDTALTRESGRRQVLLGLGWLLLGLALTGLFGLLVNAFTDPTKLMSPWLYLVLAGLVVAGVLSLRAGAKSR